MAPGVEHAYNPEPHFTEASVEALEGCYLLKLTQLISVRAGIPTQTDSRTNGNWVYGHLEPLKAAAAPLVGRQKEGVGTHSGSAVSCIPECTQKPRSFAIVQLVILQAPSVTSVRSGLQGRNKSGNLAQEKEKEKQIAVAL